MCPGVRVLRDLNPTGTYVALVGASGCGKSTTIQLVERFYDPLVGTVYLDEQPITEFNVAEYRKHIALVSQEPVSVVWYTEREKGLLMIGCLDGTPTHAAR